MSIRTRQLRRILNDIIEAELKLGRIPEYETILARLRDRLAAWQPGTPAMQARLWAPGVVCDVDGFNRTVTELHADLSDLYEEAGEISERILLGFQREQVERDALRCRLTRIDGDIDALLLKTQDTLDRTQFYAEHFADLRQVDLASTTAMVDLGTRIVRLPDSDVPRVLPINADMISVEGSPGVLEELAPISNMVDNNTNTAWLARMAYVKGQEHTVTVCIDWQPSFGAQTINTVGLAEHSMTECDISASIRTDGAWRELGCPQIAQGIVTYRFDDMDAEAVRFRLTKQETDDYSGDGWCVFGLRDVIISRCCYIEKATLMTRPVYFSKPINQAALFAEIEQPSDTDIVFEMAFVRKDGHAPYIWEQVGLATDEKTKLPKFISCGVRPHRRPTWHTPAPKFGGEPINGVQYYSIGQLPSGAIPETAHLRLGIGQIAYFGYTTGYEPPTSPAWEPMPTDFNTPQITTLETHEDNALRWEYEEKITPVEGRRTYHLKHYALAALNKVTQGEKSFSVWIPGLKGIPDVSITNACKGEISFREDVEFSAEVIKVTYLAYGCRLKHAPVQRIITASYLQDDDIDTVLTVLKEEQTYIAAGSNMLELRALPEDENGQIIYGGLMAQIEYEYQPDAGCHYYYDMSSHAPLPASSEEHYYTRLTMYIELGPDEHIELDRGIESLTVYERKDNGDVCVCSTARVAIYVNGVKTAGPVRFIPGCNSIDLLICIPKIPASDSKGIADDMRYYMDLGAIWSKVLTKATVYATRDILSYAHPDVMYLEISPTDHSRFTVTDNNIVINFQNISSVELEYEEDAPGLTADGVQIRIHLRRPAQIGGITPSVSSYTIQATQ